MTVSAITKRIAWLLLLSLFALALYTVWIWTTGLRQLEEVQSRIAEIRRLELDLPPEKWLADLLVVEDPGFWHHRGIDLSTPGAGLTTLTQGLVKIHFFEQFEPGFAKYRQSVLAGLLDRHVPKEDQLLLFLDSVRMGWIDGEPVSGFFEAARHYFGRSLDKLSHRDFLALVAMPVAPAKYNIHRNPEANAERVTRIERLLAGQCAPRDLTDVFYEACADL